MGASIEVWVLANGCADATVSRAQEACARLFAGKVGVAASVAIIESAGKSNAWNEYVHRISSSNADYLVFMDGDIQFVGAQTLGRMVGCLETTPAANVAVDTILKDLVFSGGKTPLEALSLRTSEMSRAGDPKIAGSLYVLRASVAKPIWLPRGLLVEDGFLKALILTEGFTQPVDVRRIVRAPEAAHTFEAERRISAVFRHEKRLTKGTAQNIILFRFLRGKMAGGEGGCLGEFIRRLNVADPRWVERLTESEVSARGWRVLPLEMILLPFRQLSHMRGAAVSRYLFVCLVRSLFNGFALMGAYFDLRRGRLCW